MSKLINLNENVSAIVDDEDYDFIINYEYSWYAANYNGYIYAQSRKKGNVCVKMHRLILSRCQDIDGKDVDHINHNTLDNRKENLRSCLRSDNCKNMLKSKNKKTSIYKGVIFRKDKNVKQWQARIGLGGKNKHLGFFNSEIDAAMAYNEAALKYFGEFACVNIIK